MIKVIPVYDRKSGKCIKCRRKQKSHTNPFFYSNNELSEGETKKTTPFVTSSNIKYNI